ncbi:hypothetical protein ACFQ22_01985 [Lentilactobacillus raoultii]|uniref:Uncharacterized protein n=1 Tax=Lentilactobacillus raoultii TaxID=1987503 RepID=A0ABW3PJK1_9LACO
MIKFFATRGVVFTKSDEHACYYHYACPYCGWVQTDVTHSRTEGYQGTCKCPKCWIRFKVTITKRNWPTQEEIRVAKYRRKVKQWEANWQQASMWGKLKLLFNKP